MSDELMAMGTGRGLTDRQKRLVDELSIGFDDERGLPAGDIELAERAGYGEARIVPDVARSVLVQEELRGRRVARIKSTMASNALKAINDMITSDKTPAATRFSAAKWVLEQAGHTTDQADGKEKPLTEMTEQELLAFMAKAQATVDRGGEAPVITVTPDNGALRQASPPRDGAKPSAK